MAKPPFKDQKLNRISFAFYDDLEKSSELIYEKPTINLKCKFDFGYGY
ncbi:MAG: hypothetical protein OEZ34_07130 [Spirochaetia bacterium]|nr:hypothetical protein [Spirochaetia bacterium]